MSKIIGGKLSRPARRSVYEQINTQTSINANVPRVSISTATHSISKVACICMLLSDVGSHSEIILSNLSVLQNLFKGAFFVFVISGGNTVTETIFSKINHSVIIQTMETEEYRQRNLYLKFLHENKSKFDLMVVIDPMISLITPLNPNSFAFLKSDTSYSACFSNQSYKYYDIESLITDDISIQSITDVSERKMAIKSFQKHYHKECANIPVKSAFGGFAIYKTSILDADNKYTTDDHVTFNLKISEKNFNMYIVPSFVIETSPNNAHLYA